MPAINVSCIASLGFSPIKSRCPVGALNLALVLDPQDVERFADQRNYPLEGESAGGETRRNLGPRMEDAALDCAATPGTGAIDPGRLQFYNASIWEPEHGHKRAGQLHMIGPPRPLFARLSICTQGTCEITCAKSTLLCCH